MSAPSPTTDPPGSGARLRSVPADATPEEVAAIVAAIAELHRRHAAMAAVTDEPGGDRSHWRASTRLVNRRLGMTRGPWRLSGRLSRRSRA